MMQVIGAELEPRGVAVACLRPGWVRTDMGGQGAPLDIRQSAADLVAVVDSLKPTGRVDYLDRTGERLAW
jgi:NAD(P)-dependent dehydrogenase (short-subunit alcohol dehydrogenase family)